jgi:hypothetical protein
MSIGLYVGWTGLNNMTRYEMLVGEPWNFEGPNEPNRVLVDFVRKMTISNSRDEEKSNILLKVVTPFQDHGEQVKYLIASPLKWGIQSTMYCNLVVLSELLEYEKVCQSV